MAAFEGYRSVVSQFLVSAPSLKLSLPLVVLSLLVLTPQAGANWACGRSQSESPGMDEILFRSPIVVLGKVVEQHKKPQSPGVFAAEMEVYCIYKGGPLPLKINVTDAGIVPDVCFRTNYSVGDEILAYLQRHEDGTLTPVYKEHPASYKDEIFVNCGISIEYPGTLTAQNATYDCDQDMDYIYDDAKCIQYKPKTDVAGGAADNPLPSGDGQTYTEEENVIQPDVKLEGGMTGAVEDDNGNGSASLGMSLSLFLFLSTVVLLLS